MSKHPDGQDIEVPPCMMVIFGASGDLTKRLLLPSIYNLITSKVLHDGFRLLGVGMDEWTDDKFQTYIGESLKQFWGKDADKALVDWLAKRSFYQTANFDDASSFENLAGRVAEIEKDEDHGGNRLFYLAIAPSFISKVAQQLSNRKQALGSYEGRRMLFLGLGTGLGAAMVVDGVVQTMELAHMSWKKGRTYEDYLGIDGYKRLGRKAWTRHVFKAVDDLQTTLESDYVVLGGGNAKLVRELPHNVRLGSNENAFKGAFMLWRNKHASSR